VLGVLKVWKSQSPLIEEFSVFLGFSVQIGTINGSFGKKTKSLEVISLLS
jgi:hypothetical protein